MTEGRQAGFTLVEILVALAITALAFGFAIPAITTSLSRSASIALEDQATTLAQTLLARVGYDISLIDGDAAGHAGALAWTVTITPWLNEGDGSQHGGVTLHRVAVTVSWPGVSQPQSTQLVSLLLAPPP